MFCLFNKKSIGIDIADHRVWVTRLVRSGRFFLIDSLKGVKLKPGIVENGRIKDRKELAKAIESLLEELQAESSCEKRIIFGLPKNQVYVHVFTDTTGNTDKKYIEKIVKKDTEESIPLAADDLYYNYKILDKSPEQTNILVMAVSKKLIYEWQEFFTSLKVDVQVYDLSSLATFRNLYRKAPKKPICMIDMGGDSTSITVFNNKGLRYSHAIKVAGESFTERIAASLKLSFEEADKIKIKQGFVKDKEVFEVLSREVKKITETTQDIFDYLKTKTEEDVEKIVLVGGSTLLKGLPEFLQKELGKPVEIGKPIVTGGKKSFEHLNSIGLALRGFEKRSRQKDPGLLPIEIDKKKKKTKIEEKAKTFEEDISLNSDFSDKKFGDDEENKEIKKQKIILLVILVVGAVLLGLAFLYRNIESQKRNLVGEIDTSLFAYEDKIVLQIPVAIDKSEFAKDRVTGKITETIEIKLKSDERLWPEPVLLNPNRWLVYSQTDIESLIFASIKEKIGNNFSLGDINYETLSYSDNHNILFFKVIVDVYSNQKINSDDFVLVDSNLSEIATSSEPEKVAEKKPAPVVEEEKFLIIKETPTTWLNVRAGAGLSYDILQRVDSGAEFVYLNEDNDWYEIILGEGQTGWVSGEYVNLID